MARRIIFAVLMYLSVAVAQALPLTGSLTSPTGWGLTATESWDNGGAVLTFEVAQQPNGTWSYVYNFDVDRKALSHIIFEVSKSFAEANILAGTSSGWSLGSWGDEGGSNPGIPGTLYGLKFDGDFGLENTLTIISDRAPMWGDFYAKDGKDGGDWVYAYNEGFGLDAYDVPYTQYVLGKVLVPDTVTSTVPEPSSAALMSLGLIGMFGFMRKRAAVQ